MDVMAPAKMERVSEGDWLCDSNNNNHLTVPICPCVLDLQRQIYRFGISSALPAKHPQKTLHAMRILAGIKDQQTRVSLSKAFFKVSYLHWYYIYIYHNCALAWPYNIYNKTKGIVNLLSTIFCALCFQAYWQDGYNLEETDNLQTIINQTSEKGLDAYKMATDSENSLQLKRNTEEAGERGAFGVPRYNPTCFIQSLYSIPYYIIVMLMVFSL